MNKIWVGCFLTSLYLPSVMAQAPLSLEERLAQMEQRLKATEARAASAEAEIKTLKGQQQAAIKSAGILTVVFCWVSMADGMAPTGNMPDSACSLWRIWMAK